MTAFKKRDSFRLGIGGKTMLSVAVPIAAILIVLAILISTMVLQTISTLKNNDIVNQFEAVSETVSQYFKPFFVSESFIADRSSVQEIFSEMEQSPSTYRFETSSYYNQVMRDLQHAQEVTGESVQAVWIAGIQNNQLIQSDGFVSDSSWDIHERVWYQILAENSEESILSPVYQDATSDKMIVSVAMPYRNEAGEMIGIVGIDLSMDTLETYFGGISIGDTGHIAVFASAHNLVYHPDSALLLSSLSDMPYSDNMKTLLQNQQSSDVIQYQEDGVDFYGGTVFMEEYDWSILATMPGSEYLRETTILS